MAIYNEIKQLYAEYGVKRRYRTVRDGFWIFGAAGPAGIFVNKYDYKKNKEMYLRNDDGGFLYEVDDELRHAIEAKLEWQRK